MTDDMRDQIGGADLIPFPGAEAKIRATPYVWRPAFELPRQQFLYGFELQRGHVSALVAPGAAGKSTYLMARALCMVTGKARYRQQVWNGPLRVWLWNLEDKRLHLERMLQAFCLYHAVRPEDLGDRLFLDSAVRNAAGEGDYDPQVLKLAVEEKGAGCIIQRPVVQAVIDELRARKIDHLDVDPFVSSHSVGENDNGAIDAVTKEWAHIAAEANCSISLAHHIKKIEGREATAMDARGATSLINAARSVLVINRMSVDDANACGVAMPERKFYFSMMDGKSNRAPPATKADWFKLVGQPLGNGDVGCPGPEDNVATVEGYNAPSIWGGMKPEQLLFIQEAIESAGPEKCRASALSPNWAGFVVADVLTLSLPRGSDGKVAKDARDKDKVVAYLRTWVDNGILVAEDCRVGNSEMKPCIVVGDWINPDDV